MVTGCLIRSVFLLLLVFREWKYTGCVISLWNVFVARCASLLFICTLLGMSPEAFIPNSEVKLGWFNCSDTQIWWSGAAETLAPLRFLIPKHRGNQLYSICADIIFNCASPHLEIQGGGFRSSAPPHGEFRDENGPSQLGCNQFDRTLLLFEIWASYSNVYAWGQWP